MKFKKLLAIMLSGIMAISMVACTSTESSSEELDTNAQEEQIENLENTTIKTIQDGVLTVGTEAQYAPYEFKMLVDGQEVFAGFDMDLAREIADGLGLELKILDLPFDALMLELQAGNLDMIIAGMSPTESRAQVADFSDFYFYANQAIIISTDNEDVYTEVSDLDGLQVAAQTGSIQADYTQELLTETKYVGYGYIPELILEVEAGNVAAAVVEETVAKALLQTNSNIMIMDTFADDSQPGNVVVMPKNSPEMVSAVNEIIANVLSSGAMDNYVDQAFVDMLEAIE